MLPRTAILALTLAVLFSGCIVRSLEPAYTEEDLVFRKDLLGSWVYHGEKDKEDERETAVFRRKKGNVYDLVHVDGNGIDGRFEARVFKVGSRLFLEIQPGEASLLNTYYAFHLLRSRSFLKFDLSGDTLKVTPMDYDWLKKGIESGDIDLPHIKADGDIVLTAGTNELRVFLRKYVDDEKAFEKPITYQRRK